MIYVFEICLFVFLVLLMASLTTLPYSTLSSVVPLHKTLSYSKNGLLFPEYPMGTYAHCCYFVNSIPLSERFLSLLLIPVVWSYFQGSPQFPALPWILAWLCQLWVIVPSFELIVCDRQLNILCYCSFSRSFFSPTRVQLPWVSCLRWVPVVCFNCPRCLHLNNNNAHQCFCKEWCVTSEKETSSCMIAFSVSYVCWKPKGSAHSGFWVPAACQMLSLILSLNPHDFLRPLLSHFTVGETEAQTSVRPGLHNS